MSVQLSDPEDYEGGELILVDYFNRHCQIDNQKGDCVIFLALSTLLTMLSYTFSIISKSKIIKI